MQKNPKINPQTWGGGGIHDICVFIREHIAHHCTIIDKFVSESVLWIHVNKNVSGFEFILTIQMILVKDHLNILSAQYLVHCLDTENVCHHITTMDHPPRGMKETLFTRHNQNVLP